MLELSTLFASMLTIFSETLHWPEYDDFILILIVQVQYPSYVDTTPIELPRFVTYCYIVC